MKTKPFSYLIKSETIFSSRSRSTFLYMHFFPDTRMLQITTRRLTESTRFVDHSADTESAWDIYERTKTFLAR